MSSKAVVTALLVIELAAPAAALEILDSPSQVRVFEQTSDIRQIDINTTAETNVSLKLRPKNQLKGIVQPVNRTVAPQRQNSVPLKINSTGYSPDIYTGTIALSTEAQTASRSLSVQILESGGSATDASIRLSSGSFRPEDAIDFFVVLSSPSETNVSTEYIIRESSTGRGVKNVSTEYTVSGTRSFSENLSLGDAYDTGGYYLQGKFNFKDGSVGAAQPFQVESNFWKADYSRIVVLLSTALIVVAGGWKARRTYKARKQEEARYVSPSDYESLPEESDDNYWVGKIAESEKRAFIDPDDLTTHAIVSGSTGSGKSVTASVIVEEALERDVPVVCFDPTAQWTGFVKELKDNDLFEHYDRFGMDDEQDAEPYPGVIKQINSGDPDIDFKQLQNDGEITVFTLDQLSTEEFDEAVRSIIDQIFEEDWEESSELEMLVVFDEVHRLLEEYGGEGGYRALETGAREFRKWGIGLMMCSQVTADFKQAISGNIMTEIQLQTKSMEDIKRVKKKYGEEFAQKLSSEDVGTGMIQNSNYNDGDPWFVDFRPTYHNPHKIPDNEMQKYQELSSRLDALRSDVSGSEDKELELNLAADKLKEGRFKMASMYIDELEDEVDNS
jgi:hypothetical protein